MEKPKISFLNAFSVIGTIVTLVSTFLPYSSWALPWKLLTAFVCITLSMFYSYADYYRKSQKYIASIVELENRHKAISEQFDQKNKILDEYEFAFTQFGNFITMALMQPNKTESKTLETIYRIFLIQGQKIKGDRFNG